MAAASGVGSSANSAIPGPNQRPTGRAWAHGNFYVFLEAGPARVGERHDRLRAGLNHVAFHAGSRAYVDTIAAEARSHGWTLMFVDRHPYAGGEEHHAAYLENTAGYEVELVADNQ